MYLVPSTRRMLAFSFCCDVFLHTFPPASVNILVFLRSRQSAPRNWHKKPSPYPIPGENPPNFGVCALTNTTKQGSMVSSNRPFFLSQFPDFFVFWESKRLERSKRLFFVFLSSYVTVPCFYLHTQSCEF